MRDGIARTVKRNEKEKKKRDKFQRRMAGFCIP
jgi:hypothetical protein